MHELGVISLLSEKIKICRKNKKLTQLELAELLTVSIDSVRRWESGKIIPDAFFLGRLAEIFGVSTDYLLERTVSAQKESLQVFENQVVVPVYNSISVHCGEGVEEAARRLRYAALEEERRRCGADWILLGHHAGDAEEDMLLRLLRGTGWPALGGMRARDDRRHVLRPLLAIPPDELRDYLRALGTDWREDHSNTDTRFTRNRIRHTILPLLRTENPALSTALARLRDLAALDADYWETTLHAALAAHPWQEDVTSILLPRALLHSLHPAARLRLLHHAVRTLALRHGGQARHDTLLALERAYSEGRGGLLFQLPGPLFAELRRGSVRIFVPDEKE